MWNVGLSNKRKNDNGTIHIESEKLSKKAHFCYILLVAHKECYIEDGFRIGIAAGWLKWLDALRVYDRRVPIRLKSKFL